MTAKEFIAKYITKQAVEDFKSMDNEGRLEVLKELGKPCSSCGGDGEWCCYDDPDWSGS